MKVKYPCMTLIVVGNHCSHALMSYIRSSVNRMKPWHAHEHFSNQSTGAEVMYIKHER